MPTIVKDRRHSKSQSEKGNKFASCFAHGAWSDDPSASKLLWSNPVCDICHTRTIVTIQIPNQISFVVPFLRAIHGHSFKARKLMLKKNAEFPTIIIPKNAQNKICTQFLPKSLRSNSVTSLATFNRPLFDGKCQNSKIQMRHFE